VQAVLFAGEGAVEVAGVSEPAVTEPTDAVVRVRRAAVCGTDLHLVAHADQVPRGTVLGHEFVGEVVEVGQAVRGHGVGDLVVGADFTACGGCWWCRRGDHWECRERRFFGTGTSYGPALAGAQAELVRVPFADTVLRAVPPGVPLDAAVFLGDTLATAYAAVRRCGFEPGATLAVLGGGPVGQLASLVAQACWAGAVVLVEPVAARRELGRREGALGTDPDGARGLVAELTDGRGADAVVDAVGGTRGLDLAFALVRARGTVVSVGVQEDRGWTLPVARAFADEVTLRFAIGDLMRDGDALLGLVRSGAVDPTVVASQVAGLAEAPELYRAMAERRTLKALIAV
jgi:alcohol dehydrogenase